VRAVDLAHRAGPELASQLEAVGEYAGSMFAARHERDYRTPHRRGAAAFRSRRICTGGTFGRRAVVLAIPELTSRRARAYFLGGATKR
jgi:hypothetical protein